MSDNLPNATSMAILGLLHDGPMSGGQLLTVAQERLTAFWTMTRSQVYRELPTLERLRYIREGRHGKRGMVPYAITARGRKVFAEWLSAPAGRDQLRNPLMLRMAFGTLHTDEQLEKLFFERANYHSAERFRLTQQLAEMREAGDVDHYQMETIRFAIDYHRTVLRHLKFNQEEQVSA